MKTTKKSISKKISTLIAVVAICCSAIIGITGIASIAIINNQSSKLFTDNLTPLKPIHKAQEHFQSIRSNLKSLALESVSGTTSNNDLNATIDDLYKDMVLQLNSYGSKLSSDKDRANFTVIQKDCDQYKEAITNIEAAVANKQIDQAIKLINDNDSLSTDLKSRIGNAFSININEASGRNRSNTIVFFIALTAVIVLSIIFVLLAMRIGRKKAEEIGEPIRKMVLAAESIADGNLEVDLNISTQDETKILAEAFKKVVTSLQLLQGDINTLIHAASEGQLDTRADTSRHKGNYALIIDGVNKMFDTIKQPLDVAADFINRLSDGENLDDLENTYSGYYAVLIENLNKVRDSIDVLYKEASKLAQAGLDGDLDVRGDENKLKGIYARIIHGVNQTFDAIKDPLDVASVFIGDLAAGTAGQPIKNEYKGYYSKLIDNLNSVQNSLGVLLEESLVLAGSGAKGDLSVRGDISKVSGHYADIIGGMNAILEAVSAPLNEAGTILENISKYNDFTKGMTGSYQGAFNELSNSINEVITKLVAIEKIFVNVSVGDLSLLESYKAVGRRSENDKLVPAATTMMQAIDDLISEANRLASSAIEGDLSQRGDENKFEGGYRQVIEGINRTVGAVATPLKEASEVLQEIAGRNLTVEMTGEYKGEYNKIKLAIQQMVDSFNEVLTELSIAANQVAVGSKQVSDASQSLSQGATEQASSVEELTSTITEVASQTKQNATNAFEASELSSTVLTEAKQGNEKMEEMLGSMQKINESSSNISKIIKVIDDIAFQTNILALNAAVEAARAGQYGKGFAVVAEEVRNLAAKSAEAAKDTTALIEGSIDKVESGTKIANETAGMLTQISESVNKAATLIKNIAVASNEQATAISQIDNGISQVSTVVQTNSATAEESAASSEELSGQAETLMQMVSRFKLKSGNISRSADEKALPETKVLLKAKQASENAPIIQLSLPGEYGKY